MIFVTVGTQLPFERLIDAMDAYAAAHSDELVIAQTGKAAQPSRWPHLTLVQRLSPEEFADKMRAARVVVAHAGIGTILSAIECRCPLVLVPRQHALGEHRNDHQMATARHMEGRAGLRICWDVSELGKHVKKTDIRPPDAAMGSQQTALIAHLQAILLK